MANFVFVQGKGKASELGERVLANDPTGAELQVIPVETSGIEAQSALEDSATIAEVFDGATNEATTGNWSRKIVDDTGEGLTVTEDTTNNRSDVDFNDITWTAVSGNAVSALVVAYKAANGDTDSVATSRPLTHHDFTITPDGSDVTAQTPNGVFRAS